MNIPTDLSDRPLVARDVSLPVTVKDPESTSSRLSETVRKIQRLIQLRTEASAGIKVAVSIFDFRSERYVGINDEEIMPTGSLVKVAVMIATLKKLEKNFVLKHARVKYDARRMPEIRKWDLPFFHPNPQLEIYDQQVYTFNELLYKMVALSSNRAAVLLHQFAKDEFEALYRISSLSAPDPSLPKSNAKQSLEVFKILFYSQYLSEASSRLGLYILTQSDFNVGL